jgi:hypothetical protein
MPTPSRLSPFWSLSIGLCILVLFFGFAGSARANPLVGLWEPAAEQPNQTVAGVVDQLGQLDITPTHLAAFGEAPVTYRYEQDGQVFTITADAPNAVPTDFVLRDQDTLLTRFPNNMNILWRRVGVAAAESPGAASTTADETVSDFASDMTSELMLMAMPHSRPTRYEAVSESLEALLNGGWSIAHASGAGAAMALVLERGNQHVVCLLVGNMQDVQNGRSDCRRIN